LSHIVEKDDDIYAKEILYETRLTNKELIARLEALEIPKDKEIIADAEDPGRIKELQDAGFNCIGSDKGKGSVNRGIDELKSRGLYITKDSVNAQKEIRGYKWVEQKGEPTDKEPVKFQDHFLDSVRGAVYTRSKRTGLTLDFM
jgi:phage terminase large subunit